MGSKNPLCGHKLHPNQALPINLTWGESKLYSIKTVTHLSPLCSKDEARYASYTVALIMEHVLECNHMN